MRDVVKPTIPDEITIMAAGIEEKNRCCPYKFNKLNKIVKCETCYQEFFERGSVHYKREKSIECYKRIIERKKAYG